MAVTVDEDVDGVFEDAGVEEKRGDVVEHDTCARVTVLRIKIYN